MFTINFKGKQNPKDKNLVKIDMILFKTGYPRVPKLLQLTGPFKSWDQSKQCFIGKNSEIISTNTKLSELKMKYLKVAEDWEAEDKNWSPVQWSHCFENVQAKKQAVKVIPIITMIDNVIKRAAEKERIKNGHIVTSAETGGYYLALKNHLIQFTKEKYSKAFSTYYFEDITEQFLHDFIFYLQKNAIQKGHNGAVDSYLRKFYGVFYYANENGIPGADKKLFDCVKLQMRHQQYVPRTIPYEVFQQIEDIDRSLFSEKENFHIDLFLMSFYCGGIAPIDLCYLTWHCINDGILCYERMKTPKKAEFPFIDKAQAIAIKYGDQCYGDYVLPVLTHKQKEDWQKRAKVERLGLKVNETLRKVAGIVEYDGKISWYAARGTLITKLINDGYNIATVAKYAGNSIKSIDSNYFKVTNIDEAKHDLNLRL